MADQPKYVALEAIDYPLGSGVRAYNPGDPVPAANVQEHGYVVGRQVARVDEETTGAPARSARKADWVAYAVTLGADQAVAERLTKTQLIDTYGAVRAVQEV